ncbi:MAG: GIY-YIG nuclease family protein [Rhizobiales bacterium]|nr:GIY-YIG nuclease family protein [Hyphomicrobiales bacterium]
MSENDLIKNEILNQIRKLADEANGIPPGQKKFATVTGIKDHLWKAKIWLNWTDALAEAGFGPRKWVTGYEDEFLLGKLAELANKIGHFPSQGEIKFEGSKNPHFPGFGAFRTRWSMSELATAAAEYAVQAKNETLQSHAEEYLEKKPTVISPETETAKGEAKGHVYLQQIGDKYRIGQTNSVVGRYRQVQMETPTPVRYVHTILTDDPKGVEAYWHKRFEACKLPINGDWFALKASDVAAFKKWKKIW